MQFGEERATRTARDTTTLTLPWLQHMLAENMLPKLGRNAAMGFCASVVSDTTSNSLRVLKTYRQTNEVWLLLPLLSLWLTQHYGDRHACAF